MNLDDTGARSPLDALRLFGQPRSPEAPPDTDDADKEAAKAKPPIEWDKIRADALDAPGEEQGSPAARLSGYGAAPDRRAAGVYAAC